MKIEYLKYALEIAKTKSINKAAENLFISQPNLSRAIKNLEEEIGISIFTRSNQGIEITLAGDEFLSHASSVLEEIHKMESSYTNSDDIQKFSICVPKANYISHAFTDFSDQLDKTKDLLIDYKETSSIGAIDSILYHGFNLGILRYQADFMPYFDIYLKEQGLVQRKICEFNYSIAFSKNDPLVKKENVTAKDLVDYIELTHGDPFIPNVNNKSFGEDVVQTNKKIRIYDSMGQLAMLNRIPKTFMIGYPLDEETMEKYHLVQIMIPGISKKCYDNLIYRKNYHFTKLDKIFVENLEKNKK